MQASFEPAAGISRVQAAVLLTLALVLLPGAGTPASETGTTRTRTAPLGSNDRRQLLRQLDSEDPMQRAIAATELGEHAEEGAIPHLVDLLADEAPLAKLPGWAGNNEWSPARSSWSQPSPGEAAAIALASMSARAAPALIAALQRPEPAARRNAAWALGELHHPRLEGLPEITPLVAASRDPDASVRAASAWALGEVKDRRATEPLLLMLRDPDAAARREAARALGELADPKAADELLEALLDSDSQVRTAAAWALEEIRDRIGDTARRRGY